jgi:phage-related protein
VQDNSGELESKLGGAVEKLAGFFNGLLSVIKFVIDNFKIFGPILAGVTAMIIAQHVIGTLIPLYKAWRAATVGQTIVQAILNGVMAANPFGMIALAIGAVIAIVTLLIMNWDKVVKVAKATWGWLSNFFKSKIGVIVAIMGGPITIALAIIANWQKVKSAGKSIWTSIVSFLKSKLFNLILLFSGPVGAGIAIIKNWSKIKTRATEIWGAIVERFKNARDNIVLVFSSIRDTIKDRIKSAFDYVSSFITGAIDKLKSAFSGFKTFLKDVFSGFVGLVKTPLNGVISIINSFIKGYQKLLNIVIDAINKIPDIKLPKQLGGWEIGIPDLKRFKFDGIPALAEGGFITRSGSALVGEEGPELLSLPRGAQVTPLDKAGQSIVININDAKVFDTRDGERLGEMIVKSLKLKGVIPRGV